MKQTISPSTKIKNLYCNRKQQIHYIQLSFCMILFSIISIQLDYLEIKSKPLLEYMESIRTPILSNYFKTMGFFGFEFFFLLIPVTCFAIRFDNKNRSLSFGFDLVLMLIYTWLIGSLIKSCFARLRPFQVFDDVGTLESMKVLEYSFPSGHSTGSMICWTYLVDRVYFKQFKLYYLFSWFIVVSASLSRVYFCVHFPHDIIGGWLIAFILYRFYSDYNLLPSTHAIFILFIIMIITCYFSTLELLLHMPGLILCTSSLFGILLSKLIFFQYIPHGSPLLNTPLPDSPWWKKILRIIIGVGGYSSVIFIGPRIAQSIIYMSLTGLLMSLWLLWFAPLTFKILNLY